LYTFGLDCAEIFFKLTYPYCKKLSQIKLLSHQTVGEALMVMGNEKPNSLPVYENGRAIGKLNYDDLIAFLDADIKNDCHTAAKLHHDIKSVMCEIKSMKLKYYHAALEVKKDKRVIAAQLMAGAAVLMLLIGIVWLCFEPVSSFFSNQNRIIAGLNKVELTLANGKKIVLDSSKGGIILTGSQITYSDGTALYPLSQKGQSSLNITGMASISTSRGDLCQLTLPDGTKVWLNATSTFKFPAAFTGKEKRRVELTGEAYFEVAKVNYSSPDGIKRLPFIVASKGQEIEVLGTHFNVKAYPNEPVIKTTLLEGLVRVTSLRTPKRFTGTDPSMIDPLDPMNGVKSVVLEPNQESILKGDEIVVKPVRAAEAIAWRNGDFIFRSTRLENIMLVLERWYDVEVIYQKDSLNNTEILGGTISKSHDMHDVLKSLELIANVHFKVDGKRITVLR
jgi:transmembrane sensor